MNFRVSKNTWILTATFAVLLLPLVIGAGYVFQKHQWASARLAELEPRYARLSGILTAESELEEANVKSAQTLSAYLHSSDKVLNQLGNEVQQQVRDVLVAGGLRVGSTQILPAKPDNSGFDRVQLTIKAEGELLALQTALVGLQSIKPAIFVDSFSIRIVGTPRADAAQNLSIQMELSTWRVHP